MNEKKAKALRQMAEYIAKDKSAKGIKSVYKKLKWAKKKFKFTDL
jgi:hypothetical protein